MATRDRLVFDPSDPAVLRDPYPSLAALRSEEPVHYSEILSGWIITSHRLVDEFLTRAENVSSDRIAPVVDRLRDEQDRVAAADVLTWVNRWLIFKDPPDHTRLRRHVARHINPKLAVSEAGVIDATVRRLLDELPTGEVFDLHADFSMRLPGHVVMGLLGVPFDDVPRLLRWSEEIMHFLGTARGVPNKYVRARDATHAMAAYFRALVEQRRSEPQDDIVSHLIASDIRGDRLSTDEIIGTLMVLGNAAQGTTAHLITNALVALSSRPDVAEELRDAPELMDTALEEFLRYDSPVLSAGRIMSGDTELGGKTLRKGDRVFAMLTGANRDPEVFEEPDTLDIRRDPNRHLTFSKGAHFCLGAPLARAEGKAALSSLLQRFRSIEIAEPLGEIPWTNSMTSRGPVRLPVRLS